MRDRLKLISRGGVTDDEYSMYPQRSVALPLCLFMAMIFPSVGAEGLTAPKSNFSDRSLSSVKTVHPRSDAPFNLKVEQPAEVAAYFEVSLYNETAGKVTYLEKDVGQAVIQGEKLVVIESSGGTTEVLMAPFDGVVSGRGVDPGAFVPSAAIVPGAKSLLSLERNDIVTVTSKMPERIAPMIHVHTEVEIEMNGIWSRGPIQAKVTRIAPSISKSDRTIQVEVDLYNRSESAFKELLTNSAANALRNLKGGEVPQMPKGLPEGKEAGLIPGSYGKMRVQVRPKSDDLLLPSSVISYRGGVPFVFRVENGFVKKIPVEIDLDDGETLHLWLKQSEAGQTISRNVNPGDEYVISNQGELEDSQPILPVLVSW